jgi:hypothetical protein
LRNSDDALLACWCELTTTDTSAKGLYRNAWATAHTATADNVIDVVKAARSRWKIENENHNTLKTKGYHFEHNYGHGKQHLSTLLPTLILLAFLLHALLDRLEPRNRAIRERLPSRQTFFEHLRAPIRYFPFDSWATCSPSCSTPFSRPSAKPRLGPQRAWGRPNLELLPRTPARRLRLAASPAARPQGP